MSFLTSGFKKVQVSAVVIAIVVAQFVGVSAAHAAGYLTLSAFSGTPGQSITVSGGGLNTGETVAIYLTAVVGTPLATTTVDAAGNYSKSITIPSNAPQGALSIIGVDGANQFSNAFYVNPLQASITTVAPSHAPFAVISVSGTGFAPSELVAVTLAGASTTVQASAAGAFTSATLTVPSVPSGLYAVRGTGLSSGAVSADYLNFFWIDTFYPNTAPSAYYLLPGQTLSFTGSGFAPNETINVTSAGSTSTLATFTADATGAFVSKGGFTIPVAFHGAAHTFTLTGVQSHVSASTNMTVGDFFAYASPSSYYLLPGGMLSFSGGGYSASETVSVKQVGGTTTLASFLVDTKGSFLNAGLLAIPFSNAGGTASFVLVGNSSQAQTTVSVGVGSFYPSVTPSDYYVQGNANIILSGTGFAPLENVTIKVSNGTSTVSTTANALGGISATVKIPYSKAGISTVTATGAVSKASASVDVTLATLYPSITPSAYYVFPGDKISFTGSGFAPNEVVTVSNGSATTTLNASATGTFTTATTSVPFTAKNAITYKFVGVDSGASVTSSITVGTLAAYLNSDAYSATPGQVIHVTGFGFANGETVHVVAGSFATDTASVVNGQASATITIPYGPATSLHVTFTGASTGTVGSMDIALANFYVSIVSDNYYTQPGSMIHVTGTGFAPNEAITVNAGGTISSTTANALGTASLVPVTLPFTASSTVNVSFTGVTSGASATVGISMAPFAITLSPSTYYTAPGSTITVTGTGFAPHETIVVTGGSSVGSTTASATGTAVTSITLSYSSASTATITFTGATTHASASVPITLAPVAAQVTPDVWYTTPGTTVHFTGTGFAPSETVSVSLNGTIVTSATTTPAGALTLAYKLPLSAHTAKFIFTGTTSTVSVPLEITLAQLYSGITLSSYYGQGGSALTINGTGFGANESVAITSGAQSLGTTTADATGAFAFIGHAPFAPASTVTISATGAESTSVATAPFTVAPVYTGFNLSSYASAPGTTVTMTGAGYLPNEPISITTDRTEANIVASTTTDASGNFSVNYQIPTLFSEGNLVFTAKSGHSFDTKTITFYVTGQ